MSRYRREARARNLHGEIRRFLADHPTPGVEDVTLFVELIESVLNDSRESIAIKLRANELLEDARESGDGLTLSDPKTFVEKLEALPVAAQSAYAWVGTAT
jgi:hypothetical protein